MNAYFFAIVKKADLFLEYAHLFVVKFETCFTFLYHLLNVFIYTWSIHCFFSYISPWPSVPLGYAALCLGYGLWDDRPVLPHKQPITHAQMSTCRGEPGVDSFWPQILGNMGHTVLNDPLQHTLAEDRSLSLAQFAATYHPMLEGSSRHVYVGFSIISHRADQHVWFWWSHNVLSSCK